MTDVPPLKQRLYDIVRRAGSDGIPSAELYSMLYDNRRTAKPQPVYLRVHVNQLNKILKPRGERITGNRRRGIYVLLKERHHAADPALSAAASPG